MKPNRGVIITTEIQKAIDSCAAKGAGIVIFPAGIYLCGGIELKSNVTLQLNKGAVLQGSAKYTDYKNDAFIYGKEVSNISIQGEGMIDGVDCVNPTGEEGFRGPHCIRLVGCKNINFTGITIQNSANWAINCRYCSFGTVKNVTILGGHDGLHTRFCDNFTVTGCDFKTGDDAFAGNDNRDFMISDCKVNTSCNGFRMGCLNFTVLRTKIYGPGKYIHKIQKRSNMLSAFVHFAPKDDNSTIKSGNWLIKDVVIENVDRVYNYNYEDGLWQTGQPVTNVKFENVNATGILSAFYIIGDAKRSFSLDVKNSSFAFRNGVVYDSFGFEGAKILSHDLFFAKNFNEIRLKKVVLDKKNTQPLNLNSGNSVVMDKVSFITGQTSSPYKFEKVLVLRIR
ncbi:glycoside hydrolase family 28 protein [Pedobacter sp. JCM 36344]|uniref:glycoside hydrolase family 28 protein n=1 Tax=Pedobacter sp. JCM 36344 TaxID=3374280 RepID=UPI00397CC7B8